MCHTHIALDPEADAKIASVFDAAVAAERSKPDDARTFDQLQADVVVELIVLERQADRTQELSELVQLDRFQRDGIPRLNPHGRYILAYRDAVRPVELTTWSRPWSRAPQEAGTARLMSQ